eukprot:364627-Chlamydomonas_euryale.AAC.5
MQPVPTPRCHCAARVHRPCSRAEDASAAAPVPTHCRCSPAAPHASAPTGRPNRQQDGGRLRETTERGAGVSYAGRSVRLDPKPVQMPQEHPSAISHNDAQKCLPITLCRLVIISATSLELLCIPCWRAEDTMWSVALVTTSIIVTTTGALACSNMLRRAGADRRFLPSIKCLWLRTRGISRIMGHIACARIINEGA